MDNSGIIELFNKKKACFIKIKEMTEKTNLDETMESTDAYVSLMARRSRVFSEIGSLDKAIAAIQIPNNESSLLREIERIQKEMKDIIQGIIKFDEQNQKMAQKIKEELKRGLKEVHKGKQSSKMYNHDVIYSEISRFDSKR